MKYILDVPVEIIKLPNLADKFFDYLAKEDQFFFTSINPEILVESFKSWRYKNLLKRSKCNFADGIGLVGAYYFTKKRFFRFYLLNTILNQLRFYIFIMVNVLDFSKKRLAGVDFFVKLLTDARINKYKIFLVGGKQGVLEGTIRYLLKLNKNLNIVGFNDEVEVLLSKDGQIRINKEQFFINHLNDLKPDIIFIGLGYPKQEYFADYILKKVKSLKFTMGVGGTFDYLGGKSIRAPEVVRKLGFEWLWRLFFEPRKRLFRIIKAVIIFPWLYLKNQKI